MTHFYIRLLALVQLIIHTTGPQVNCAQGPQAQTCVGSDLLCTGFESCLGDLFICTSDYDCEVSCNYGSGSCRQVTIDALEANSLTISCGTSNDGNNDQCKNIKVNASNIDGDIQITCTGGQHMCSFSDIHATGSNSLTIDCDSFESCQAMNIYCANDCNINCNNNQNNVCNGMSVTCGSGNCIIDCSNGQKCGSMGDIVVPQSSNFTCIGTTSECLAVSNNIIIIPSPPTSTTTTNNPTPSPTNNPTPSPTFNPTPSPTFNHTPTPTNNPTPSPTNNPTPTPTLNPTFNPTSAPTTLMPTTVIPTSANPSTFAPTTNIPTTSTTIPALTPDPTTAEPSRISSITKTPTTSTVIPTRSAERGVDVDTTLELDSSAENVVSNKSNSSWIYIAAVLVLILICIAGILICRKVRKSDKVYYFDNSVMQNGDTHSNNRIVIGSMSDKMGEGNKKMSIVNGTETVGVDEKLVDTNMINNVMMDDVIEDMNEYETPMGNDKGNINDIEMQNMNEGYGEIIIDDEDETPSGGTQLLYDKEIIGDDVITSGNDQFDQEGTDPDVDDIDDTIQNHMYDTVQ